MAETPQFGNSTRSLRKTLRECEGNICQCLAEKITDLVGRQKDSTGGVKGLSDRFAEQVAPGASGPNAPIEPGRDANSWTRHDGEMQRQQQNLDNHLDEYEGRGCGGGPGEGVPADARHWATRPRPTPAEWEANNPGIPRNAITSETYVRDFNPRATHIPPGMVCTPYVENWIVFSRHRVVCVPTPGVP